MKIILLLISLASISLGADCVVPREGTEWCNIWMANAAGKIMQGAQVAVEILKVLRPTAK